MKQAHDLMNTSRNIIEEWMSNNQTNSILGAKIGQLLVDVPWRSCGSTSISDFIQTHLSWLKRGKRQGADFIFERFTDAVGVSQVPEESDFDSFLWTELASLKSIKKIFINEKNRLSVAEQMPPEAKIIFRMTKTDHDSIAINYFTELGEKDVAFQNTANEMIAAINAGNNWYKKFSSCDNNYLINWNQYRIKAIEAFYVKQLSDLLVHQKTENTAYIINEFLLQIQRSRESARAESQKSRLPRNSDTLKTKTGAHRSKDSIAVLTSIIQHLTEAEINQLWIPMRAVLASRNPK
jgi:hypothetical protein